MLSYVCISQISAIQQEGWTAACYKHFKLPPQIVTGKDGIIRYSFVCLK
jgi:hypothetical protein